MRVLPKSVIKWALFSLLAIALPMSAAKAQNRPWSYLADATKRFFVLPEFYDLAVLDRSTGLIWLRQPGTETLAWNSAEFSCNLVALGHSDTRAGITGWRLPAAHEMMTLIVKAATSCPPNIACGEIHQLPAGHPFNVGDTTFWTSTADLHSATPSALTFSVSGGISNAPLDASRGVWCVRGSN